MKKIILILILTAVASGLLLICCCKTEHVTVTHDGWKMHGDTILANRINFY